MPASRFGTLLAIRLVVLLAVITAAAWLTAVGGYPTVTLLLIGLAVLLIVEIVRFISMTNRELARFLDAVRYGDFGQRFELSEFGAGFQELGSTFTDLLNDFRASRGQQEHDLRHLKAILEHVPVPLISVYADESITLWNNAARRLFGATPIARLSDLEPFGAELPAVLATLQPGERSLARIDLDGLPQSFTVSVSEIATASRSERLISLQNISTELDSTQLRAWQDLVRVLTHEIMNSITPVSSLAKTASDLVEDVGRQVTAHPELVQELDDVKDAVDTVARRSNGLMSFVSSYQRLTRLPKPERSRFRIRDLFDDAARIVTVDWPEANITLDTKLEPAELVIRADREMLEQVLINLLQNAEHALADTGGTVTLSARLSPRGRIIIEVGDDGPGISDEVAARMFVPFFTTRKDGSGVGLALSRQIMNAHDGTISFSRNAGGGARFTLAF
jgi:two-component system nitrogen regulation sensor histidine kinase NtrY